MIWSGLAWPGKYCRLQFVVTAAFERTIEWQSNSFFLSATNSYPHWPAIVCNHPSSNKFFKVEKGCEYLNVQFFDAPPQRAWIKVHDCILFENGEHPKETKISDESLSNAIGWALEALECAKQERGKFVVPLKLSDEEDSDGLEELGSDIELSPLNKSSRIAGKRKFESDSEADDVVRSTLKKKKKPTTFLIDSGDSEDEYKPGKLEEATTSSESMISDVMSNEFSDVASFVEDESFVEEDDEPRSKPTKKSNSNRSMASSKKPAKSSKAEASPSAAASGEGNLGTRRFPHLTYNFLKPEFIKDKAGRRPDHPDYDPKTLYVPPEFLKKQTPTQKQWWLIKQDHFDTLLFFKMGKFYELFHMDAVIINEVTNILFMRGDFAHAGFPEGGYAYKASACIEKGYKVARVEQTESAEARDSRLKGTKGSDKVVRRELCRVTSKGTKTMFELASCADEAHSTYILAITEKELDNNQIQTGLCFIDTSLGEFHIGQLVDDKYSTLLRTIFAHYPPVEILLEKDSVTSQTLQTIKSCLPDVQITYLKSNSEFWKPRETLKLLMEGPYFKVKRDDGKLETQLPEKLKELLDPSDVLSLTVKHEFELSLKAFGAIIYQLKRNLIEEELLALRKFNIFDTNFLLSNTKNEDKDFMVLDSVTIKNLELLENSEGSREGTLLQIIDTCKTKFGKRRLRKWICSPLCSKREIDQRLGAVGTLMNLPLGDLHQELANLPDLERILFKIHTQSLANRSKNHPDSRAVFHEFVAMNKSKVSDFCKLLESFHRSDRFVNELRSTIGETQSPFLSKLVNYKENGGIFPNTKKVLLYFDNSFDQKIAKDKGVINPKRGVNQEYEAAEEAIKGVHKELNDHLKKLSSQFGVDLKYAGTGKNRFQIEFPERLASRIPKDFEKTGSRKGFEKYQDRTVKSLLEKLKQREAEKAEAMQDAWRIILQSFMEHADDWLSIIQIVAILDCLIALANYANSLKSFGPVCRPKILEQEKNVLRFKAGQHPSLVKLVDNFMANDLELDEKLLLLSGANMGGK